MEQEKVSYGALDALIVGTSFRIFKKKNQRLDYYGAASYCPSYLFGCTVSQLFIDKSGLRVYLEDVR